MSNTERKTMTTTLKVLGIIGLAILILFNDALKAVAGFVYYGGIALVDWITPL